MPRIVSGHYNRRYEPATASLRAKVSNYRAHAKRRGIEWGLEGWRAALLLTSDCHYCGSKPGVKFNSIKNRLYRGGKSRLVNQDIVASGTVLVGGIDRISSDLGYIPGNCLPCCTICNRAKMRMSYLEYRDWMDRAALFRTSINARTIKHD